MKHLWASLGVRASLLGACFAPAWAEPATGTGPAAAPPSFEVVLAEADRRFVAGDLDGALRLLEPVCREGGRAECAFSLGAVHHGLGHCPEARSFYRRYLELAPDGERGSEVRDALEEVEARCGDRPAPAAPGQLPGSSPWAPSVAAPPSLGQPDVPVPLAPPAAAVSAIAATPEAPGESRSLNADLAVGSFVLSGAAALSSIAFGLLAAHDASRCANARTYDQEFIERCENSGPRYQGLWQGFALASGNFLGIGLVLLAFDPGAPGAASSGSPQLGYRGRF